MKNKKLLILFFAAVFFMGCSKDAEDAANSSGFSASDINGTWKEGTSGFTMRISGVSSSSNGTGVVVAVGTAFPAAALNGTCMKEVEHQSGGYWDAYNQSYSSGGTWYQSQVIGLAMNDAKTEFKIGTKVYKRQ